MAKVNYSAVGRRKKAVARIHLVPGDGKIVINKRDIDNYFGLETLKMTVRQPLTLTNVGNFDVMVNVNGGGLSDGSIVLLHDIHKSTVDSIPALIDRFKKQGYTFVTVTELLQARCGLEAGKIYYEG